MKKNEAIEVIKKNYPHVAESGSQFETALRILIPELKESEDEKIKKYLLTLVNQLWADAIEEYGDVTKEKVISWLKKQGEQKPVEWTHKDGKNLAELWEILSVHRNTNPQVDNLMEWVKDLVSYKRQEWSEDDEIALNDALWCCEQAASIAKDENDMGNVWYAENWLQSLKERYTWKPSEEQMKALEYYTKGGFVDKEGIFGGELVKLLEELKKL